MYRFIASRKLAHWLLRVLLLLLVSPHPTKAQNVIHSSQHAGAEELFLRDGTFADTGSHVQIQVESSDLDRVSGIIEVQIQGVCTGSSELNPILDCWAESGFILVAVPDAHVEVHYDNILIEYFDNQEWKPFACDIAEEPGRAQRAVSIFLRFVPVVGTVMSAIQSFSEGVALVEEYLSSNRDLRGPSGPQFSDLNEYDLITISWDSPIDPAFDHRRSLVDLVGKRLEVNPNNRRLRSLVKMRFSIPYRIPSAGESELSVSCYALFSEHLRTARVFGQGYAHWPQKIREAELTCALIQKSESSSSDPELGPLEDYPLQELLSRTPLSYDSDSDMEMLVLGLEDGRFYNDEELWCGFGEKYEGRFSLLVVKDNTVISISSLNELMGQESMFMRTEYPGGLNIEISDYNHDGQPDFAICQYFGCNGSTCRLFTVTESGLITNLRVSQDGYDIGVSGHPFSERFALHETGFLSVRYSQSEGEYRASKYKWNGDHFEWMGSEPYEWSNR